MCGLAIQPNPANMCVNCMRNQVDITETVQKQVRVCCQMRAALSEMPNAAAQLL